MATSSSPPAEGLHPPATIIICARNAECHLPRSVGAALAQDYPGAFEVLVVDNASTDSTAVTAQSLGARVIAHTVPGVAGARQAGWKHAKSPIIAYLDADCEPPADWLSRAVSKLNSSPRVAIVGVKLVEGEITSLAEEHIACQGIMNTDYFWQGSPWHRPFVLTAGMVVRRAALEQVGGFDETLGRITGEDADLCFRVREAGWDLSYAPEIEIIHHHRATIRGMMRQAFWYGQGSAAVFARWRHRMGPWARFNPKPWLRLARALVCIPFALIFVRHRYRRLSPILRVLDVLAHLAGKWSAAFRYRVFYP
jgi:GT2 family glycosyltransferase